MQSTTSAVRIDAELCSDTAKGDSYALNEAINTNRELKEMGAINSIVPISFS